MVRSVAERLRAAGLKASGPRLAVAELVLDTVRHPTADQVLAWARASGAPVSRATVYKTLVTLVEKGLIQSLNIDGRQVFDPRLEPHHHLVDAETGAIHDVPLEALEVIGLDQLSGVQVEDHHVVIRGRIRPAQPSFDSTTRES